MIKIHIDYEGPARFFRQELMQLLGEETVAMEVTVPKGAMPSAPVDGDTFTLRQGETLVLTGTTTVPADEPAEPVRKRRRSKAEPEAVASPEPPQAAEEPVQEEPVDTTPRSVGTTYWLNNELAEVFALQDGDPLPDADAITDKTVEQLEDENEYVIMKKRCERLREQEAKKAGPAAELEAEVEEELADGDTVLKVAGDLLELYDDEVAAAAAISDTVKKLGKAERIRDVDPENAPAVVKELKRLMAAFEAQKAAKKGRR
jgi:hypothetical protein